MSCLHFSEDEITSESEIEEDDEKEEDTKPEENVKAHKRKRQLRPNEVPELLAKRHKAFKPYRYILLVIFVLMSKTTDAFSRNTNVDCSVLL